MATLLADLVVEDHDPHALLNSEFYQQRLAAISRRLDYGILDDGFRQAPQIDGFPWPGESVQ